MLRYVLFDFFLGLRHWLFYLLRLIWNHLYWLLLNNLSGHNLRWLVLLLALPHLDLLFLLLITGLRHIGLLFRRRRCPLHGSRQHRHRRVLGMWALSGMLNGQLRVVLFSRHLRWTYFAMIREQIGVQVE